MDTLDLRSSPSPMEGVSSNDENVKVPSSSSKYKLQRDKERYMVDDDGGEEEEDEEDEEDDEDDDDDDQEYFEQSQDEESSESPSNRPSSSTACSRKSKSSLRKSFDRPGPSSSILKNSDRQWPSNTQPLKDQVDENKAHQIRMKNLRKHIDYIEQTNWLYTPIEELIGHTDSSNK